VMIRIVDSKGNLVYQQVIPDGQQKFFIELDDQAAGIYMLKISADEINVDRKISILN